MQMQVAIELSQAIAHHQRGALSEARTHYEAALAQQPDHPGALHLCGMLVLQQKAPREAVKLLRRAAAADPSNPHVHNDLGCALKAAGRWRQALACFDAAIRLSPGFAMAHGNRGNTLRLLKRLPQALESLERAVALAPQVAEVHVNRGTALQQADDLAQAMACYDQALRLDPDHAQAHFNRGTAWIAMGQPHEACACFERAHALGWRASETLTCLGMAWLTLGDFERGWPLHEARLQSARGRRLTAGMPGLPWRGDGPVQGRTLLLHAEQGLGDMIQMCRFAPQVAALGARVILQVHRPLAGLLRQLPGVEQVIATGDPLPAADGHCALYSLPLALGVRPETLPCAQGYLRADPLRVAAWQERLGPRAGEPAQGLLSRLRVGLVWSGNPLHPNDRQRSLWLSQLRAGLPEGPQYVSLQRDLRQADRQALADWPQLRHFGAELRDFEDTAALCEALDLVISVDTSVAHLAGALGVPVWILLSFPAEWRWMMQREDTPWYASARLYRQGPDRDWAAVFERLRADLASLRLRPGTGASAGAR